MASFRYLFYDWSSQLLLDSFTLEDAALGWEISTPGTMTADVPLLDPTLPASRVIPATIPLRTKVFVEREGTLIWGGQLIEPRAYDSTSGKLTLNAQETVGYFKNRFTPTLALYGTDQITIAETILAQLQADTGGYAGLTVAAPGGLSGILRDGVYSQWAYTDGLTAITDLTEMESGFEFATQVVWGSGGMPAETLILAFPRLGKIAPAGVSTVLEYNEFTDGGNVLSYQWPEGPGLFTRTWADATTPDGVQLDASYDASNLLSTGYPLFEQKVDFSSANPTTLAALQLYANKQGKIVGQELVAASFTCKPDSNLVVGNWSLGDDVLVRISDYRFPPGPQGQPGFAGYMRIAQAQLTTDTDGLEQYVFTLDNYWGLVSSD